MTSKKLFWTELIEDPHEVKSRLYNRDIDSPPTWAIPNCFPGRSWGWCALPRTQPPSYVGIYTGVGWYEYHFHIITT